MNGPKLILNLKNILIAFNNSIYDTLYSLKKYVISGECLILKIFQQLEDNNAFKTTKPKVSLVTQNDRNGSLTN